MKQLSLFIQKGLLPILLFIGIFLSGNVKAQEVRCGTMYMDSLRYVSDPNTQTHEQFEQWLEKLVNKRKQLEQSGLVINGVYTIPVVFHVIHDNDPVGNNVNLSQAVIQSQVDVLNEDFRKIFGTPGYNTHPDGADTKIEFCMAQRRPDGSAFPGGEIGINRINRNSVGWTAPPYTTAYIDGNIKPYCTGTQFGGWDPADYMNIWICEISGGILGYAQFPTTSIGGMGCGAQSTATDGVVFLNTSIGKSSVSGFPGPYNEGRTATHEVGHWLGLRHIWGDGGCGVDDFCADTPLSDASNFGCPTTNSCLDPNGDPNDMVENYMDYTDDICMNIFTYDQMTRMRTVLENSPIRASLIVSDACIPPATSDASIIGVLSPLGDNCAGTITPQVVLKNRGSSTLTSATISYTIDGTSQVNFSWTGSVASGGTATVALPGFFSALGIHDFSAFSTLPNGVVDPDPTYDTTSIQFAISNGYQPNYSQDFEAGQFPPDVRWLDVNVNGDCMQWIGQSGTSSSGSFPNDAACVPFFNNNGATQEEFLYSPFFILPCNASAASVSFDRAYRRRTNASSDRLRLEMSLDCGVTWTNVLFDLQGNALSTGANSNTYWIPSVAGDWTNQNINLLSYVTGTSQSVQFRFRANNSGNQGGNVYVDNFNFTAVTPAEIEVSIAGVDVLDDGSYNFGTTPIGSTTTATFTITNTGTSNLILTPPINITGSTVYTLNSSFGTTTIAPGGTTTFSIDFTPTGAGPFIGNLYFATNDCDEGFYNFELYGSGNVSPPTASFTAAPTTICEGATVTYTDASTAATSWAWSFPGGTPSTATGVGPHVITYATAGTYDAQLTVTNAYGSDVDLQSNLITVLSAGGTPPPITEGFVGAFVPAGWSITNGGNALTWVKSTTIGNAPTAGNSAYIDNFNTNTTGNIDDLNMIPADLTGVTATQLQFDVAYAPYNGTYFDQLDVVVSGDCGATWQTVYSKSGTTLATDAATTAAYSPGTWRTETINLSAYDGVAKLEVKFRNISGWGQFLYIDNINLTGTVSSANADFNAAPNPVCVGNNVTFTDASTGATSWDWNFGTGATPATATGAGPHIVTYASSGVKNVSLSINGGASVSNQTVTVNPLDNATFSYASSSYCVNSADPTPTVGMAGGTFTSSPAGLSINAATGQIDVSASTPGAYTVTYTTAGTCPNASNVSVTINALDDASFAYGASAYCVNAADPTPTITGLGGGTFSSSPAGLSINAATGQIDVSASTPGAYTVTYTTVGTCPNASNVSVTINALDNASFSYGAAAYCVNAADPTPTITGLGGGTFTNSPAGLSINAATGQIDVSASTPNAYTVTYTTAGTCPNASNVSVTINALDNASFSYGAAAYCVNAADPTPTITGLGGGTFTSSPAGLSINSASGQIDVSASTPNTYTVTYTTAGTCPNASNVSVTINALDNAAFAYSGSSYCISGSDPTPSITGLSGGTFTSSPAGLSINATTGTVDVSASTPGSYTITYTTAGTCPNSSNVSFSVTALDDATFTYGAAAFCVNGTDPTPVANTAGGSYSSAPAGLSINTTTGTIDVSASTPGSYTVTYVTGGSCSNSSNVSITINAIDNASFSYGASAYCVNASDPMPAITGLGGGTFTSSPAGLSINSASGQIDVSASTPNTYTVTYTTAGACPNASNVTLMINALDNASFNYGASSYCVNASDPTPTITGLGGGTFTSSPAGLSINATTGTVDVSASTPGSYTITYTTAGTCPNSSSVSFGVTGLDDASFTYGASSFCVSASDPTPIANTGGGTFTSTPAGLSINASTGTIDVSTSTPGSYTVTYTTGGACSNSSNVSVTINTLDNASFSYGAPSYCVNGTDPTPSANTAGGTYTSSPAGLSINATTGTIDVSASTPGAYTVTYTTAGACSNSSNVSVMISAADDATVTYASSSYCSDANDPSPSVNTAGGTFTASPAGLVINSATGIIDVSASTPGTYSVSYTTAGSCPSTGSQTVTINAAPTIPVITAGGPTTFCNGSSVQLTSSQANGNMWSTGATSQAITAVTSGLYTVTYTDANGCSSTSAPITVVVNANPNAPTITANGPTTFCDGGSVTLTSSQGSGNVWSTTETTQSIVVTTSGIYEVTYTNTNGCSSTSSQLTVNVNALPSVVLGAFTDVCSYVDPITLSGGSPAGGTYSGTGVSSGVFDPSVAGIGTHTITYTYIDANGCSNSAQSTIVVNDCAGIDELSLLGLQVYPNPATTGITVKSNKSTIEEVRLIDAAGRLVELTHPMMNNVTIDLSNYSTGSYIVEIITESGLARTQLIKQ